MRLSHQKQYDIKETILKHLYDASKQRLDDKKGALVLRNHSEWIKPYMTIINQLPDYLLNTAESIQMEIPELSNMGLDDAGYQKKAHKTTWTQFVDAGLPIMRKGSGWNAKEIPIPLQDGMREEVIALRTEDFELSQEKRAMEKYLDTTMEINNTTSKLRKVFPSTLQKYIPPEPPRAPRQPKLNLDTPEQPDVPGNLKKRLTENLLNN
tara:strand:+ start:1162 stop:1788 length:627 start_codon:yes stop_codon:yes gene_type:complete